MTEETDESVRAELAALPLLDFIERASNGRYRKPEHFAPIAEVLTDAEKLTGARDVIAAPVQHGKTTIIEFVIAWILLRHPDRSIIYLTYAQRKAEKHSRRIRAIYTACGGRLKSDFNTIQQWQTDQGGGLLVTSRDGEITGNDAVHVFFDDPYKDRVEAEHAEVRERLEEKFSSEVVTRVAPGGSITIIASRWDEDDLSGVKIREGWRHTHLRAIETDADGNERALCPWGPDPRYPRDLAFLRAIRDGNDVTEHDWYSLYQGEPRPRGAGLFNPGAVFLVAETPGILRYQWGADFAYSSGGDRIALVLLGECEKEDLRLVLEVFTWARNVLEIVPELRAALSMRPEAPIAMYASGPERGAIRSLGTIEARHGGPIFVSLMQAGLNKYLRSGPTARRWNNGGIRTKAGAPWAPDFLRRVKGFTGNEGGRDDEVDALVSANDAMDRTKGYSSDRGYKFGKRRM
jgi:hypothetical protein